MVTLLLEKGVHIMNKKVARIISILAFVALLRPCAHLWQFMELLATRLLGFGYDEMPTTRFLFWIYGLFGPVAANLVNWAIGLILAAVPTILLYRFLIRRDLDGVCKECASRKILSWSMFLLFILFSIISPQWILWPQANDCEQLPLEETMSQNPAASLEVCLCHPDSDKLVDALHTDGELAAEALATASKIDGYRLMPLSRDGTISDACYVSAMVELSNDDLESVTARSDSMNPGTYVVCVKLNSEGRIKFRKLTEDYTPGGPKNQNGSLRRLAIVVNGRLVVAPAIYAVITNGEFIISGNYSADEASILAAGLNPRNVEYAP